MKIPVSGVLFGLAVFIASLPSIEGRQAVAPTPSDHAYHAIMYGISAILFFAATIRFEIERRSKKP